MMKKLLLTLLVISSSALAADWYQGGTLHDKRVNDWKRATYQNRLATSADFTAFIFGEDKVGRLGSVNALRPYAVEMMTCVDEGTKGDIPNILVAEVATSCALIMGWR